jgi:2-aminoadipate transaminase
MTTPAGAPEPARISTAPPPVAARLRDVASSPVREILALTQRPGVISFAGGLPAPELFDAPGLRAAFAAALADDAYGRTLQYSTTEGDPRLRAAIAARLGRRGLPTDADDVLVTSGSQQALTLVAAVLLEPGDAVLVEEPSYLAALQCFQMAGARVVPIPCDDDGLDPDALAALVRRERPKLLYTVPTFHNPTGRTLPLERRRALAQAAGRLGLWIVEDDPYGELRYRGEAVPPVASLPGAEDRTIALSTLSKVLVPGLRIGWVRAPAALRRALVVAKQAADLHTSTIDQAAAAHWLAACDLDAHIAGLCAAYGPRRDALVGGLPGALPEGSRWTRPDGGMFVWVRLPDGWDADALLAAALEREVAFVPGWPFYAGPADHATLRLSFTTHTTTEIAEGLGRLRAAVDSRR